MHPIFNHSKSNLKKISQCFFLTEVTPCYSTDKTNLWGKCTTSQRTSILAVGVVVGWEGLGCRVGITNLVVGLIALTIKIILREFANKQKLYATTKLYNTDVHRLPNAPPTSLPYM